jgi:D-alanine-D-alanine ligase
MYKMAQQKIRVGILFGGKSAEHEISLLSAKNVIEALDREKYEPVLIGIDKKGEWHRCESIAFSAKEKTTLVLKDKGGDLVNLTNGQRHDSLDVIFPILHGTYGEDGTVQGLLKLANIPFVGSGVLGSAVGMDKDVMKRLLRDAQITTAKFVLLNRSSRGHYDFSQIVKEVGLPFFVKPANLGSSVGISKVKSEEDFIQALACAFDFDHKVLVEEYVKGREIECAVLGNENPKASLPGEVIPQHEFYSYEAKYLDPNGALFQVPAELDQDTIERIQFMAIKAYHTLCCEGMARVDFFLKENGDLYLNEVNTIPGFTNISMYPKMWEASGLAYSDLIDTLIQLAIDRFEKEKMLKTTFSCKKDKVWVE